MWMLLLISLSIPNITILSTAVPMVDCFRKWEKVYDEKTNHGTEPLIGQQLICMRVE